MLDDGEPADSPRAMAQAGPYAAIAFHNLVEEDQFGSVFPVGEGFPFKEELEDYRKVYEKYEPADARYLSNHRGHLMFVRPEEKHLTANVISGMSLTGTRSELAERLRGMERSATGRSCPTSSPDRRTTCCSDGPTSWRRSDAAAEMQFGSRAFSIR